MDTTIKAHIQTINTELKKYNFGTEPQELYEPIGYLLDIGGKRLRPVLTLLSYSLFNDEITDQVLYPAMGLEVFHNFTLMHDDIMDNAPRRRGKTTVHEKWNNNIAILSGDVMLVKAYELFLKCEQDIVVNVLTGFNACAAGVCEGQQYDMNFETINSVSEVEYINMIRLKTSVLLGFSLELGAILAKAPESMCAALYSIGCDLGIGFQLKDDLLDVYGDTEKFGKQVGGDIISNKKTYLLIKALELAGDADSEALNYWLKQEQFDAAEKVSAVTKIYNNLGIQQLTEQKIRNYFDQGLKKFDELDINENNKTRLREFFYQLIEREK